MTLLDIGCGWGATMRRAVEHYDVNVIGLTLSENQHDHAEKAFARSGQSAVHASAAQGWEQFDEPVDRIVSIGAFEHFGHDRHDDFFAMAHAVLPDDGVMLLHTITRLTLDERQGARHSADDGCRAVREVHRERDLPRRAVADHRGGRGAGRRRRLHGRADASRCNCTTRARWTSGRRRWTRSGTRPSPSSPKQVYDRYMKYLTGCADMFRKGYIDVNQFTLHK